MCALPKYLEHEEIFRFLQKREESVDVSKLQSGTILIGNGTVKIAVLPSCLTLGRSLGVWQVRSFSVQCLIAGVWLRISAARGYQSVPSRL